MSMYNIFLLLHFIGIGMIFAGLIGGFILSRQYKKSTDYPTKLVVLQGLRVFGLLTPFSVLIMVISGIGNMESLGYGVFTAGWLSAKLILVVIMIVNGLISGARSKKRGALKAQLASGNAPPEAEKMVTLLERQGQLFFFVSAALLLVVLTLSIVKP